MEKLLIQMKILYAITVMDRQKKMSFITQRFLFKFEVFRKSYKIGLSASPHHSPFRQLLRVFPYHQTCVDGHEDFCERHCQPDCLWRKN